MDYLKVRVTLSIPENYIPKDVEEPEKVLAALITAGLLEFSMIRVVKVNKRDLVRRK